MVTLGSLLPVPVHSAAWRETNLSNISCLTNETERLETDFKSEVIIPLFTFGSIYSTNASEAEKCLKQIIEIKLNRVKNPNWPEANQLAIYKRGRGFELGTTENKSSWRSVRDLNLGPPNCKSGAQTARSRCPCCNCLATSPQQEMEDTKLHRFTSVMLVFKLV